MDSQLEDLMRNTPIAAPCSVKWENMTGDDRARLCAKCDLHVVNTFMMTDEEALEALARVHKGEHICMRVHRRSDGTFMTRNCPVGVQRIRERAYKVAAWIAGGLSMILSLAANAVPPPVAKTAKKKPTWHSSIKASDCNSGDKQKTNKGGPRKFEIPQVLGGLPAPSLPPPPIPAQLPEYVQVSPALTPEQLKQQRDTTPIMTPADVMRAKGVVQINPAPSSPKKPKSKAK